MFHYIIFLSYVQAKNNIDFIHNLWYYTYYAVQIFIWEIKNMTNTFSGAVPVTAYTPTAGKQPTSSSGATTDMPTPSVPGQPAVVTPDDVALALGKQPRTNTTTPSDTSANQGAVAHANHEMAQQQDEGNIITRNWKLLLLIIATLGVGYFVYKKITDYKDERKDALAKNKDLQSQIDKLEDQIDDAKGNGSNSNTNNSGGNALANSGVIVNTDTVDQLNNIFSGNSRV